MQNHDNYIITSKYQKYLKKLHNCDSHRKKQLDIARKTNLGQTMTTKKGLRATILNYRFSDDIDIEFETGYIARNRSLKDFKRKDIGHPFPYTINDIELREIAYTHRGINNFYCECLNCQTKNIWDLSEIYNHKCKEE